jgi:LCP family protein required for cell wall assembly
MQSKRTPTRSLDGFIPQSNAPRRIGFDVVKKVKSKPEPQNHPVNFPVVGQTLSSYSPAATMAGELPEPRLTPSPFDLDIDEQPAKKTKHRRFRRTRSLFRWKRIVAVFFLLVLAVGGWLGFKFVYNTSKTFQGGIFSALSTTKLKGEDVGRVNILVAGNSSDDVGHDGAQLTDSIMIISLNTKDNTAFMLSVPRDLWVDIPDYGHAKINEAYVDGQAEKFNDSGYFPGGMGLLQKTIQENFNLNLNYYALVDYSALRDMVNAVGGITVTIASQDKRGLYDPSVDYANKNLPLVKLTNGVHQLNGAQALGLARARGDAYGSYGFPASDFDRTSNQRQELLALKSKVISAGVLANPAKISSLLDSVGKNVITNMTLGEVRRAYDIGKNVSNIQSVGLNSVQGKDLLASYTTPLGQSALIPASGLDDFTQIQALIKQLTSSDQIVREGASVVVLNATSTTGLASTTAKKITAKNITVAKTDDAATQQATTTIIDASNGKMPATEKALTGLFGTTVTTTNPYAGIYNADFIVVVGANQIPAPKTTTTTTSASQ